MENKEKEIDKVSKILGKALDRIKNEEDPEAISKDFWKEIKPFQVHEEVK